MSNTTYVRDTIDLIKSIETRFLELGERLYKIREKQLWQSTYETYQEFLDAARISPSMASILVSIHRNYIIEQGVAPEKLTGIGYSNLFEAIPLIEKRGIKETLAMVSTLTRSEIKDEVRDQKHGEHQHVSGEEKWSTCEICGKFIREA